MLAVHYSKYELGKFKVYTFTVRIHCWQSVFQPISELLHFYTVESLFLNQSLS